MRQVLPLAMLSALLAMVPAALAQHGDSTGHGSAGGFHGRSADYSFHGGFSTPASYGRFAGSAPRSYGMASAGPLYSMRVGGASVYRPTYRADYQISGRRGHYRVTRHGDFGYGAYPGYVNSWELLPWNLGYPDMTDEDTSASQPAGELESQPESESESGPPPPDEGYREDYAPAAYEAASAMPPAPLAPEPQLTLIFMDGHTEQIRNYVLTQDALLDMDHANVGRVARIPLASLNLPATEKAAQQAGLEFAPPTS